LDAKVDVEMDNLHIKIIAIEDLVGYVYIVRVDVYILIELDRQLLRQHRLWEQHLELILA
jgi:hypothetical protein